MIRDGALAEAVREATVASTLLRLCRPRCRRRRHRGSPQRGDLSDARRRRHLDERFVSRERSPNRPGRRRGPGRRLQLSCGPCRRWRSSTATPRRSTRSGSRGGKAAILGLVEGLSEYLPISSTGHLLVANSILGLDDTEAAEKAIDTYAICIQAGAIFAVLFLYWGRVRQMLDGLLGRSDEGRRVLLAVISAFIPTAIIGVALADTGEGPSVRHRADRHRVVGGWPGHLVARAHQLVRSRRSRPLRHLHPAGGDHRCGAGDRAVARREPQHGHHRGRGGRRSVAHRGGGVQLSPWPGDVERGHRARRARRAAATWSTRSAWPRPRSAWWWPSCRPWPPCGGWWPGSSNAGSGCSAGTAWPSASPRSCWRQPACSSRVQVAGPAATGQPAVTASVAVPERSAAAAAARSWWAKATSVWSLWSATTLPGHGGGRGAGERVGVDDQHHRRAGSHDGRPGARRHGERRFIGPERRRVGEIAGPQDDVGAQRARGDPHRVQGRRSWPTARACRGSRFARRGRRQDRLHRCRGRCARP